MVTYERLYQFICANASTSEGKKHEHLMLIIQEIREFLNEDPDVLNRLYDVEWDEQTETEEKHFRITCSFLTAAISLGAVTVVQALLGFNVNLAGRDKWIKVENRIEGETRNNTEIEHTAIGLAIFENVRIPGDKVFLDIVSLLQSAAANPRENGVIRYVQTTDCGGEKRNIYLDYLDDKYHKATPTKLWKRLVSEKSQKVVLIGTHVTLNNAKLVKKSGQSIVEQLKVKLPEADIVDLMLDKAVIDPADTLIRLDDSPQNFSYHPFDDLSYLRNITHVVLSLGINPIPLFQSDINEREDKLNALIEQEKDKYLQWINSFMERGLQPILVLPCVPDATKDTYFIYELTKLLHRDQPITLSNKMKIQFGFHSFMQYKLNPRVSNVTVKYLQQLMQRIYQPILQIALDKGLPIVDLCSSINHRDTSLYVKQIHMSPKGGDIITNLLTEVITTHDFNAGSKMYSTPDKTGFVHVDNTDPDNWRPHYNLPLTEEAAVDKFKEVYKEKLTKDKKTFPGKLSKSHIDLQAITDTQSIFYHAKHNGKRSAKLLVKELEWADEKTLEPIVTFKN